MVNKPVIETGKVYRRLGEFYSGYTYPEILDNRICKWLWKKFCCSCGWHLWDEALGEGGALLVL